MPVATKMPKTNDSAIDRPLVMFFSARDCSFCRGLMRFCAKPMMMADTPAASGMNHEMPPSSKGTMPRSSVPGAPWSVTPWMTSTNPNRMMICTASGTRLNSGWYLRCLYSSCCLSPMVSRSPKYLTLMRLSSGISCTMTMLFFWHHRLIGIRMILTMTVNSRMASHQLPVSW